MRRRNETDDRIVAERIAELARGIEALDDDVLRDLARAAAATEQDVVERKPLFAQRRRLALGWTVVPVAAALLLGSGLGFGIASSATPTGEASTPFAGFGFLPLRGWTVVQGGALGTDGSTTATAANVALRAEDRVGGFPRETLLSLPRNGIVVHATFAPRGDPEEDFKYADATLPLELGAATFASTDPLAASAGLAEQRIRAGVGSYNVDARVFYGSASPKAAMLAAAQRQLDRLIAGADRITLVARPTTVAGFQQALLFGAVSSGRADEEVTIQAKDCGARTWTGAVGVLTHDGGTYNVDFNRGVTTTVRALWKDVVSAPITIRQRVRIDFLRRGSGKFAASAVGRASLWRRTMQIQRRQGGSWKLLRTVRLTDSWAAPGSPYVWNTAEFALRVPRGTLLRAVLPQAQAKPCYLSGVSRTVRT